MQKKKKLVYLFQYVVLLQWGQLLYYTLIKENMKCRDKKKMPGNKMLQEWVKTEWMPLSVCTTALITSRQAKKKQIIFLWASGLKALKVFWCMISIWPF